MKVKDIKKHLPKSLIITSILRKSHARIIRCRKTLKINGYILDAKLHPTQMIYYCPCCNNRLRSFKAGYFIERSDCYNPERYKEIRQEVQCPICESIPRHRIMATWMDAHKEILQNKKILYFALEKGINLWLKRNSIQVTTADLYASADLKLNIEDTKLPDSSWDWIVCNHVLEHVTEYKKALRELYRILKPDGKLIISFPILDSLPTLIEETGHTEENKKKRIQLYGQADHLRIFGRDSKAILESIGFSVTVIDGSKMPQNILPVVGPADYDVNYLFLCQKSVYCKIKMVLPH